MDPVAVLGPGVATTGPATADPAGQLTPDCSLHWLAGWDDNVLGFYAGGGMFPATAAGQSAAGGIVYDTGLWDRALGRE